MKRKNNIKKIPLLLALTLSTPLIIDNINNISYAQEVATESDLTEVEAGNKNTITARFIEGENKVLVEATGSAKLSREKWFTFMESITQSGKFRYGRDIDSVIEFRGAISLPKDSSHLFDVLKILRGAENNHYNKLNPYCKIKLASKNRKKHLKEV